MTNFSESYVVRRSQGYSKIFELNSGRIYIVSKLLVKYFEKKKSKMAHCEKKNKLCSWKINLVHVSSLTEFLEKAETNSATEWRVRVFFALLLLGQILLDPVVFGLMTCRCDRKQLKVQQTLTTFQTHRIDRVFDQLFTHSLFQRESYLLF